MTDLSIVKVQEELDTDTTRSDRYDYVSESSSESGSKDRTSSSSRHWRGNSK
jgi:hypothetical protein